jgi:hypothetical protein
MMQFWTNFAKSGNPGSSSNGVSWLKYDGSNLAASKYMVLDKRSKLRMKSDNFSFSSLVLDLYEENDLSELEKCVVLLQMLTYVGDDLYDEYIKKYPGKCSRKKSEQFIINNSDFINY